MQKVPNVITSFCLTTISAYVKGEEARISAYLNKNKRRKARRPPSVRAGTAGPRGARGRREGAEGKGRALDPRRKGLGCASLPCPVQPAELHGPAMEESSGIRLSAECLDEPPNSRVFVVLGKDTGEALIRERFSPFGDIQNIWLLRDRRTNESRGIAFIKFARSSQACRAMEEMHGRSLVPDGKPIKVQPGAGRGAPGPGRAERGQRAGQARRGLAERPQHRPCVSALPAPARPSRARPPAALWRRGPSVPQNPAGGLSCSRPAGNAAVRAVRDKGSFVYFKCCKQENCE